jgi:hypothetical protein
MQRLPNSSIQFQLGVRGWVAIAVSVAILAVVAFLAIGLLILILPVVLLAPILFWFLPKPKFHRVTTRSEKRPTTEATVIEGHFKVIDNTSDRNSEANDA